MASTVKEFIHLRIPLEEIVEATNNFADKNIIGKGGFGIVYRGKLMHSGKLIKISARRLDRKYGQGDVEFWTEVSMLSSLEHKYIVSMIGYCDSKDEKIIVNKFYPKGSLLMHLSDPTLRWSERVNIAVGVAMAIDYLHYDVRPNYVIHRNINSSTILLDENWEPKLSGFEFSIKHSINRQNEVILSEAIGTYGYIDPEIYKTGGVTHKSDIYSFGVVLLELLCGRRANEGNTLLAPLAISHYKNHTLPNIIHPGLRNQIHKRSYKVFTKNAFMCLASKRSERREAFNLAPSLLACCQENVDGTSGLPTDEKDDMGEKSTSALSMDEKDHTDEQSASSDHKLTNLEDLRIPREDLSVAEHDPKWGYLSRLPGKNKHEPSKGHYKVKIVTTEGTSSREIEIFRRCRHPNIESILGFCDEGYDTLLVYEYIDGTESLSSNVQTDFAFWEKSGKKCSTWEKCLKIFVDVARGLNYLQNEIGGQKTVIHSDINSSNIMVDKDGRAKITGFINSVLLTMDQDDDALRQDVIVGETYYVDPEYAKTGKVKPESDVFSFGVLMSEIFHGSRVQPDLVRQWFKEGIIKEKLASKFEIESYESKKIITKGCNEASVDIFLDIVYKCLAETQDQRPQIKVVLKELEKALSFQENHRGRLWISFEDIKSATQDFSPNNYIGVGGFGEVFKGKLAHKHGSGHYNIVAKKLDKSHGQGEKQYYNELQILYEYKHENIIGLLGYSNETNEKFIVYEEASKGSLDKYLNDASLIWRKRLEICIDVATALNYIHGGAGGKDVVVHRDIKSANILLFDDWNAKVGDFGLSLISTIKDEEDFAIDHACGTMDYLDPLYLKSGLLTVKSDVYSFGIVLLEILYGRAIYSMPNQEKEYLLNFIKHNFDKTKQDKFVFKAIRKEIMPKSLTTFLEIVQSCLAEEREKRLTSKEVLSQLEKALELQEDPLWMSFEDIKSATQDFSLINYIGVGSFGELFKGKLAHKHGNGHYNIVAKKLDKSHGQGEKQYYMELGILSSYEHQNIIDLLGYSDETNEKIIVYEEASKGSLDRCLNDASIIWRNRLKICIDVATGLDFIHGGDEGRYVVVHRNIKSANILLFDNWNAKVGGFELSMLTSMNDEENFTIDYLDPLYLKSGLLTDKYDVYSFGIVLLEILYGRAISSIPELEKESLLNFIKHNFDKNKQDQLVFKAIRKEIMPKSLTTFLKIVQSCLAEESEKRPTSKEVLSQLKTTLEFQNEEA